MYDTGLLVPFLARWPGRIAPGSVADALISQVDVLPTLVDLAGGTIGGDQDGRSFKGVLLGRTPGPRDRLFASHTGDGQMNVFPQRCVRDGRYKYILNLRPENTWRNSTTPRPIPMSSTTSWGSPRCVRSWSRSAGSCGGG